MSCAYCGGCSTERDHLTGRTGPGSSPYFDPFVWVPSCHSCNTSHYQDWGILSITAPSLEARPKRLAFGLGALASGPCTWAPGGLFWSGLQNIVIEITADVEVAVA